MHSAVLSNSEIARLHTEAADARRKWEASTAALKKDLRALTEHNSNLKELWTDEQTRCTTLDEQISEWASRFAEAERQITEEADRSNLLAAEVQLLGAQNESAKERNQVICALLLGNAGDHVDNRLVRRACVLACLWPCICCCDGV